MNDLANFSKDILHRLAKLGSDAISMLVEAAVVLAIGYVIIRMVTYMTRKIVKLIRMPAGLRSIIVSLVQGTLWFVLFIVILNVLGFSGVIIFFSSSVAALGIMMAAGGASVISDILAGIFLADNKHFEIGDQVRAGENETEGIIENMDIRRIEIRTKDGKLHVLPNSVVERKEWVVIATRAELARKNKE